MRKRIVITLLLQLITAASFAVSTEQCISNSYIMKSVNSFDGLPQNDVHTIHQDSYGLMWIGTNSGLSCYDGNTFRQFSIDSNGLTTNFILSVSEDSVGNLWIGTADKGMFYYMRDKNRFVHYLDLFDDTSLSNVVVNAISAIYVDAEGVVWAYNRPNATLVRLVFSLEHFKIESLEMLPIKNQHKVIEPSVAFVDGRMYVCGGDIIYTYDETLRSLVEVKDVKLKSKTRSIVGRGDWLHVSQYGGIYSYNTKSRETSFTQLNITPRFIKFVGDDMWLLTPQGLFKMTYDDSTYKFTPIEEVDRYDNLFPNTLVEDNVGGIWVGFAKVGMKRYQRSLTPFYLRDNIGNDLIVALKSFGDNELFVGSDGSGLFALDGIDGATNMVTRNGSTIYSVDRSEYDDRYYFSTRSKLFSFDRKMGGKQLKLEIDGVSVRRLIADGKYIWLASYDDGLLRLNLETREIVALTISDGLPSSIVRNVMFDRERNLWVCTSKGVVRINNSELESEKPRFESELFEKQGDCYAIPIIEDRDGDIWYGTLGSGLYMLTPSKGVMYRYDVRNILIENGLQSKNIKSIVEDNNGDIWISTNKGLSRITKSFVDERVGYNFSIDNFNSYQYLRNYEFGELSATKLESGELLFGGVKGVTYFDPSRFEADFTEVLPIVTDVKISGESIFDSEDLWATMSGGLLGKEGMVLNHTQNDIAISYTGINFNNPHSNSYKYMLSGVNSKFVPASSGGVVEINYANLRPGEYTFRLQVANSDGSWSGEILELPITILPPFWATWYAYLVYLLLFMVAIYYSITAYHNFMKRRNQVSQAKFEKSKMEEMLDSRTRFFTNVSHEFRTPLTLILTPLQQLLGDEAVMSNPRWLRLLQTMNYSGNSLLRLVNDFLNYTKQENGLLGADLHRGDFRSFAHRVSQQFVFWAECRGLTLRFISPERPLSVDFDPYLMEQLLSNLISNAIKYTHSGGDILFAIDEQAECVICSVKDNGTGIPEDMQPEIFERFKSRSNEVSADVGGTGVGLYLSHKLVELHGGEIWFESSTKGEHRGTTFYVKLPKSLSVEGCEEDVVAEISTVAPSNEDIETTNETFRELFDEDKSDGNLPTLLIVDDNPDLRATLRELFLSYYEILEAEDGVLGLEVALREIPDIILSDVMMPKMDGLEMCEKIKSNEITSHIPVVMLSAKASCEDVTAGYRISADGYCAKPFNNQMLVETVNSTLINRRRLATIYMRIGSVKRELSNESDDGNSISNLDAIFLEKIEAFIKENMHKSEFIVNDVCEHMKLSRLVLNKKLKSLTDVTAISLIRKLRLQRAAELLRTGRYSVSDVTYDVGFNDLKHFRDSFRKEFGILPQEYKEQFVGEER